MYRMGHSTHMRGSMDSEQSSKGVIKRNSSAQENDATEIADRMR